jgi:hypothetical protein
VGVALLAASAPGQELTRAVTSDEAPLAARSRTRRRRPTRSLVVLAALLALASLASASWFSSRAEPRASSGSRASTLASGLHEARPMPTETGASRETSKRAGPRASKTTMGARGATSPQGAAPSALPAEAALKVEARGSAREPNRERKLKREASDEPEQVAKVRELRPVRSSRPRDCAQPYEIDALGIRRWKRECL